MVTEERFRTLEHEVERLGRRLGRLEGNTATEPATRWAPPLAPPPPAMPPVATGSAHDPTPPLRPAPAPRPTPPARPKRRTPADMLGGRSLEDLLGGSVLAWVGGLAVLIGVAFLFAVAVSRGWIGEAGRTLIAGGGSAALLALGIWLHEKRARTDAALAAVATGVSALFVTFTVAAQVYELIPAPLALAAILGVGSLATALAVRWESRGIAALGIVGALLSPVLAGAPYDLTTMAILLLAAGSAVGVLLRQQWSWLASAVFVVTVPQWVAFLFDDPSVAEALAVLIGFGAVGVAAAVGYEVRAAAEKLRPYSAFLLALNAVLLAVVGWFAFAELGHETVGRAWLAALALAHVGLGITATRSRVAAHDFGLLALTIGVVIADVAFALSVGGPARTIGFAGAGVLFAALVRRRAANAGDAELSALGLGVHVALALMQVLMSDAPPALIGHGGLPAAGAVTGLMAVVASCFVSARLADAGWPGLRMALDALGLAVLAYLAALTLDGAALTVAWSVQAVVLARVARPSVDPIALAGAYLHLVMAGLQAVMYLAPPETFAGGVDVLPTLCAFGAVMAAAFVCARVVPECDDSVAIRNSLDGFALTTLAYLLAVMLDGAPLVLAFAAVAAVLCERTRSSEGESPGYAALAFVAMAAGHVLVIEAPPVALVQGVEWPLAAAVALAVTVLAGLSCARVDWGDPVLRRTIGGATAVAALYAASVLVVTPFQPGAGAAEASVLELGVRQQGQVLVSALWTVSGFAALILGLRRDLRAVRLGALALLMGTVGKVFLYDLATLTSIYRVISFIGLGLMLLAAAFTWQRLRPRELPDMRQTPEGIR